VQAKYKLQTIAKKNVSWHYLKYGTAYTIKMTALHHLAKKIVDKTDLGKIKILHPQKHLISLPL